MAPESHPPVAADPIFRRSTGRVRVALALALVAARQAGQSAAEPGHLLLGLLRERGGVAAQAMAQLEITERRLTAALAGQPLAPAGRLTRLGDWLRGLASSSARPVSDVIPLTAAAARAWQRADQERQQRREEFLATEHMLLGLLADERGEIAQALARLDLTPTMLRGAIWAVIEAAMRRPGGV